MTTHHSENIDSLLVKTLLGEATKPEQEQVSSWLAQSPENRSYYGQLKTIWEKSQNLRPLHQADENLAWERFKQRTSGESNVVPMPTERITNEPPMRRPFAQYLKVAAAILVFAGLGAVWLLTNPNKPTTSQVLVSHNQALHQTLPDGSIVTLNRNSKVTFSSSLNADPVRALSLEGEAFFEVAPDVKRPFVIEVEQIKVKVLGTSFNVKSQTDRTEVAVSTGKVEVTHNDQSRILLPGQTLVIPKNSDDWRISTEDDQLYQYYVGNKLIATRQPLLKVVNILSEFYEKPIVLDDARAAEKITTVMDLNEPLAKNLEILNSTMGTRHEERNGTVTIK